MITLLQTALTESFTSENCININTEYENWFWITTSNQWESLNQIKVKE